MKRWAFNLAAAVSLVLLAATVALWVWSCHTDLHLGQTRIRVSAESVVEHRSGFFSARGTVYLANGTIIATPAEYPQYLNSPSDAAASPPVPIDGFGWFTGPPGRFGWFYSERDENFNNGGWGSNGQLDLFGTDVRWDEPQYGVVALPHLYFALVFAVLPVWWALLSIGIAERLRPALVALAALMLWGMMLIYAPICGLFFVPVLMAVPLVRMLDRANKRSAGVAPTPVAAAISAPHASGALNVDRRRRRS